MTIEEIVKELREAEKAAKDGDAETPLGQFNPKRHRFEALCARYMPAILDALGQTRRERDKLLAVIEGNNVNQKRVTAERDAAMKVVRYANSFLVTKGRPSGGTDWRELMRLTIAELRRDHPHLFAERKENVEHE